MIKHFNVTVTGKVHGVFFRASTKQMADLLGISGFVRNQPTSDVYIEAEGEEEMLTKFLQWCHHGPSAAEVKYVSVLEGEVVNFEGFVIRK